MNAYLLNMVARAVVINSHLHTKVRESSQDGEEIFWLTSTDVDAWLHYTRGLFFLNAIFDQYFSFSKVKLESYFAIIVFPVKQGRLLPSTCFLDKLVQLLQAKLLWLVERISNNVKIIT